MRIVISMVFPCDRFGIERDLRVNSKLDDLVVLNLRFELFHIDGANIAERLLGFFQSVLSRRLLSARGGLRDIDAAGPNHFISLGIMKSVSLFIPVLRALRRQRVAVPKYAAA